MKSPPQEAPATVYNRAGVFLFGVGVAEWVRNGGAMLLVNRHAGRGPSASDVQGWVHGGRAVWKDRLTVRSVEDPGDLRSVLTRHRHEVVVVAGGDGSLNRVTRVLLAMPPEQRPALSVLPAGTGSDFARGLGLGRDRARGEAGAVWTASASAGDRSDALRVAWWHPGQTPDEHAPAGEVVGINLASCGMSAAVVAHVEAGKAAKRWIGGLVFLQATVAALWSWRSSRVRVTWPGGGLWQGALQALLVANGRACGGGMFVAPSASLCDGLLDFVLIPHAAPLQQLVQLPRLYRGDWQGHPTVRTGQVPWVEVRPIEARMPSEIDGEPLPGCAREGVMRVSVVPGALELRVPRG